MANNKPTASERDRTLSGQWTKSEKRAAASRSIMFYKKTAHEKVKAFKHGVYLNK